MRHDFPPSLYNSRLALAGGIPTLNLPKQRRCFIRIAWVILLLDHIICLSALSFVGSLRSSDAVSRRLDFTLALTVSRGSTGMVWLKNTCFDLEVLHHAAVKRGAHCDHCRGTKCQDSKFTVRTGIFPNAFTALPGPWPRRAALTCFPFSRPFFACTFPFALGSFFLLHSRH